MKSDGQATNENITSTKTNREHHKHELGRSEFLIVFSIRHGDGQTGRGVHVSKENVSDGAADLKWSAMRRRIKRGRCCMTHLLSRHEVDENGSHSLQSACQRLRHKINGMHAQQTCDHGMMIAPGTESTATVLD